MIIEFKRLSNKAKLPTKAHPSDAGLDLYAAHDAIIEPGETVKIDTDLAISLPEGYEAQVRPRSGITLNTKLRVQLGTIDAGYRGNIGITIDNIYQNTYYFDDNEVYPNTQKEVIGVSGDQEILDPYSRYECGTHLVKKGDKIAQLVVQKIPQTEAAWTEELSDGERGQSGFGSSGTN